MFAIVILSAWLVLADVRHAAFSVFAAVLSGGIGDAVVNCLLRVAILSLPLPIEAPVIPVANEARSPQEIKNARNKCLARNNKSGPVQSDTRLGTADEPIHALARRTGQQGSNRGLHRPLNGRFCDEANPCSEVPSLSLTVRWGQFPPW